MAKTKTLKNHKKQTKQKGGNGQDITYEHNNNIDTISNIQKDDVLNFRIKFYINTTSHTPKHSRIAFCESTEDKSTDACYDNKKRWFKTENQAGFTTEDFNKSNISFTVLCSMKVVESRNELKFELTEIKSIEFKIKGKNEDKQFILDEVNLKKIKEINQLVDPYIFSNLFENNTEDNTTDQQLAIATITTDINYIITDFQQNTDILTPLNPSSTWLEEKQNAATIQRNIKNLKIKINKYNEKSELNPLEKYELEQIIKNNYLESFIGEDTHKYIDDIKKILNKNRKLMGPLISDTSNKHNVINTRKGQVIEVGKGNNTQVIEVGNGNNNQQDKYPNYLHGTRYERNESTKGDLLKTTWKPVDDSKFKQSKQQRNYYPYPTR